MSTHKLLFVVLALFILDAIQPVSSSSVHHNDPYRIDTLKKKVHKNHLKYRKWRIAQKIPANKIWYDDCVFVNKYTVAQRLKKYPFFKAAKIIAVSHIGIERNDDILIGQPVRVKKDSGINIINDTLDYSVLKEYKQLNKKQINYLTSLIYNTDIKVYNNYADPGVSCFEPRNGFVFIDKNGKAFDYLDICFHCGNEMSSSGKISTGVDCNQKYDLIRKLFIKMGITYGTTGDKSNFYHRF